MTAVEITIENEHGLHARPASALVKLCSSFEGDVRIDRDGTQVDGKSLLGVLKLGAKCGDVLKLQLDAASDEAISAFTQQLLAQARDGFE